MLDLMEWVGYVCHGILATCEIALEYGSAMGICALYIF